MYLFSIYILSNKVLLNKLFSISPYFIHIINFYKATRIGFILFELLILCSCLGYNIYFSYIILLKLNI